MKIMVVLVLVMGAGCAPYYTTPGRYYGGQQFLRVQNEEAGIQARGWTTGQQLPTVAVSSAHAKVAVTDANTRADTAQVAVRTEDYVARTAVAAQTSERERLIRGLAAQQAACAARFADGHESVTCMVLNQQATTVLNGGQGYYMPTGGSWYGGGGNYSVSAIRTAAAIEAARRFRDARRAGVVPYGTENTSGEAVDSEAREAVRGFSDNLSHLSNSVRALYRRAAPAQQGGGR